MNIKIKGLLILALISVCTFAQAQLTDYSIFDQKFNFYIANDLGRNGYYDQKPIAELMGTMGEEVGYPSFRRSAQRERPLMDDQLRTYLFSSGIDD